MAELERADWVKDQTQTTGTGAVLMDGVAPSGGFRTYAAALVNGKRYRNIIYQSATGSIECSEGVWNSAASTMSRDTVIWSTNGGTGLVNFGVGIKEMWVGPMDMDFEQPDFATGASVASAATLNLDSVGGGRVHVTGTTAITAITLSRGPRTVIFDGSLTLTHNATTCNLPGGANITTQPGDRATFESDGATVYCTNYQTASGHAAVESMQLLAVVHPTAVAAINLLNVFSSKFNCYRIVIHNIAPAATDYPLMQFAVAGALDTTSGHYTRSGDEAAASAMAGAVTSLQPTQAVSINASTPICNIVFDVLGVNDAAPTSVLGKFMAGTAAGPNEGGCTGVYTQNSVLTGFGLFWNGGGNFKAQGTIAVYGYNEV